MSFPTWQIFSLSCGAGLTLIIIQKPRKFLTILVMLILSAILLDPLWGPIGVLAAFAYKLWKK